LVYASNGNIVFTSTENIPYTVYNINGNIVSSGMAATGCLIALLRGVYIVKMENQTQKVVL